MTFNKSNAVLTLGTFLLVLIPVIIWAVVSTKPSVKPGQYANLAKCLTDTGAKMYGAYWCSHCQEQKKKFGDAVNQVPYIECSLPDGKGVNQLCIDAGIKGYPTWILGDGQKIEGAIDLSDLAIKSGCPI